MGTSHRAAKVADRIKVVIAQTLETKVKDPRLGFITVTDVRITGDLQQASIFYTVLGDDESKIQPFDLNRDKWTNQEFGNKDFLINTIDYLLDDTGLIYLRSKTVKIAFLNKQKAYEEAVKWQLINILFPLVILGVFGLTFNYFKKKKYS